MIELIHKIFSELKFQLKKIVLCFVLFFTPFLTLADDTEIGDIIEQMIQILNIIVIPLLLVIATLVFIWGVIQYIIAGTSEQRKKEGQNLIKWGLIGLLVIVAMWGFVKIIGTTFEVPSGQGEGTIPEGPSF